MPKLHTWGGLGKRWDRRWHEYKWELQKASYFKRDYKKITDEQGNWFENCFFSINFVSCNTFKNVYVFIVFRLFCLINNGNLFMPLWSKEINYE